MQLGIIAFCDQLAKTDSATGGGSATAVSVALAAALLEKSSVSKPQKKRLETIRRKAVQLARQDSVAFTRALKLSRSGKKLRFVQSVKCANAVQQAVLKLAEKLLAYGRSRRSSIKPAFRSDCQCALALARAAQQGARALILANVKWLKL